MNILPFVITIILILGMFSLSQLKQARSIEKEAFSAYFKDFKKLRNEKVPSISKKKISDAKSLEKENYENEETKN